MKKLLINHQWNKCASQSIKKSLKEQIKHIKLFDSHHRTEDIRRFLYGDKKISAHKGHSDQFHLNKDFDSYKKYTVCVIRDPYNRWLSSYFQRLLKPKKNSFEQSRKNCSDGSRKSCLWRELFRLWILPKQLEKPLIIC